MNSPHYHELMVRAGQAHVPVTVLLEVTFRCPFRCRHCYTHLPHQTAPDRATAFWLDVLDQLARAGTLFVTLSGGEPLTRSDWPELLSACVRRGFYTTLFTSGYRVNETAADGIAATGVAAVELSYYSHEAAVFDRITGVPGSHGRVLAAIGALRRRGVNVILKSPGMRSNYRSLPDTCRWAETEGVPLRLDLLVFPPPGTDWRSNTELLHGEELSAAVELLGSYLPSPEPADSGPEYSLCAAGTRFCVIRPDGKVRACSFLPEAAGDLTRDAFATVWTQSPVFRRLRAADRRTWTDCTCCALEPFCRRCPAFIRLLGGSWDKIPAAVCDMCRRRLASRLPGGE